MLFYQLYEILVFLTEIIIRPTVQYLLVCFLSYKIRSGIYVQSKNVDFTTYFIIHIVKKIVAYINQVESKLRIIQSIFSFVVSDEMRCIILSPTYAVKTQVECVHVVRKVNEINKNVQNNQYRIG
jgi:hypothetical protein